MGLDYVKHPDFTKCIEEVDCCQNKLILKLLFLQILGADSWSECKDCIKVICRALRIPGFMQEVRDVGVI